MPLISAVPAQKDQGSKAVIAGGIKCINPSLYILVLFGEELSVDKSAFSNQGYPSLFFSFFILSFVSHFSENLALEVP